MQKDCFLIGQQTQASGTGDKFDPRLDSAKNLTTDIIPKNATWWTKLKEWVLKSSVADRQDMIGRLYYVRFSTPLLSNATAYNRQYVRCIGYDCDGDKTLTFQTMDRSAKSINFGGPSPYHWFDGTTNSTVRQKCIDYYNAFPGKESVKTVQKKYNTQYNATTLQEADKIYDETFFLPSYAEMGFGEDLNQCPCMDEFCVLNTSRIPYQYYTNNNKRKKFDQYYDTDNELYDNKTANPNLNTPGSYWLRSHGNTATVTKAFGTSISNLYVSDLGTVGETTTTGDSNTLYYLAPAFVIG